MTTTASAQRRHGALPLKLGALLSHLGSHPAGFHPPSPQAADPAPAMMQVADATGIMAGEADEWTRCREQARDAFLGSLRQDVANLHAILQSRQALLHAQATGAHPAGWARAAVGTSEPALVEGTDQDARPRLRALPTLVDDVSTPTVPPVPANGSAQQMLAHYTAPESRVAPPVPALLALGTKDPGPPTDVLPVSAGAALPTSAEPANLTGDVRTVHVYQTTMSTKSRARSDKKIERTIVKWQERGYVLTEVDDQRSSDASVLKAVLTFHRPA